MSHARPEAADYRFTMRRPLPGMMAFEDVQIQLIGLRAVASEFTEPWMARVFRNADPCAMVIDARDPEVLDEIEFIEQRLGEEGCGSRS